MTMPAPSGAIREYQSDPPSQLPPTAARPAVPEWLNRSLHTRAFLRHGVGMRQEVTGSRNLLDFVYFVYEDSWTSRG
jgi:hypothetical protein